ncbi:ATP-dependent DNA helicase DinG [Xylophilus sp.]|uniref:ATP-dependent DNA helicase DinG n=1 Tax=Xylophilus sp. TaxID=2653893 RepID=UPI0013BCC385|nr:ATP-dependent DNA helicase DinG [Xylophilus sp.]KAF1046284.1 MAG: putative ATP-dependent helicase DinG [Xylophilus sp.]
MSSPAQWADAALQSFDAVVSATSGFRSRPGQRRMAEEVARVFSTATLGRAADGDEEIDPGEVTRAIAVIQAGTGVGKSLAYCAPAVAIALARGTRVVISTATVALQEQLVHKDLPALAAQFAHTGGQPFRWALAKGRGRYVCRLKLERLAGAGEADDGFGPDDDLFSEEEAAHRALRPAHETEARMRYYAGVMQALAGGAWDGDRDTLDVQPEADAWQPMAAHGSSCTGRHCPSFNGCIYYERRKELVGAQVVVANHDLLLASLGSRLLPDLDNSLLVLDEAHHLPATALDHFAGRMELSRLAWLDKLAGHALRVGGLMEVGEIADLPRHTAELRRTLGELEKLVMETYGETLRIHQPARGAYAAAQPARARVPRGELPEQLQEPVGLIAYHAGEFLTALQAISKALRAAMRHLSQDRPDEARRLSVLYAQLGTLAPRLEQVHATAQLLLKDAEPASGAGGAPHAKWFTLRMDGEFAAVAAHASPLLPGTMLRNHLWGAVRGAVLTSATLTSCGQFGFFMHESGLHGDPDAATLEVPSPFDYAAQGRFVTAETRADPRDAGFNAEMADRLIADLAQVGRGALVLFTAREQMRLAVAALPPVLRAVVLVQNELPRLKLLEQHRARVAAGEPSVIFGMQSFGEGLDLPGAQCETVFIAKLPFASPDDPVSEARAEWLRSQGRDPFSELVVPATAIRLAQWVGRAIRTEDDRAAIYCYDKRLVRSAYGKRLLDGLPPFTRSVA